MTVIAQILGSRTAQVSSSADYIFDSSGVQEGNWQLLILYQVSATTITVPAPPGWEVIVPLEITGTLGNVVYGRVRLPGDPDTVTFSPSSTSSRFGVTLIWGVGRWSHRVVGATKTREATGTTTTNVAPGVYSPSGGIAIAISNESTNTGSREEITSVVPSGWSRVSYLSQPSVNLNANTIAVYSKQLNGPSNSGDVTFTYTSASTTNGWAVQIVIAPKMFQDWSLVYVGSELAKAVYIGEDLVWP